MQRMNHHIAGFKNKHNHTIMYVNISLHILYLDVAQLSMYNRIHIYTYVTMTTRQNLIPLVNIKIAGIYRCSSP